MFLISEVPLSPGDTSPCPLSPGPSLLRRVHAVRLRHAPESRVVPTPSARERSSGSDGFGLVVRVSSLGYRGTSLIRQRTPLGPYRRVLGLGCVLGSRSPAPGTQTGTLPSGSTTAACSWIRRRQLIWVEGLGLEVWGVGF